MEKVLFYAFRGEASCFAHVMINALDLKAKGHEVEIVLEGEATRLLKELVDPKKPFHSFYNSVIEQKLIAAVCKACANQMGSLKAAEEQGLPIVGDLYGHPSLKPWLDRGFKVITM
ncbi:MAG: DsrE family protein [Planctomycetota bacterium]